MHTRSLLFCILVAFAFPLFACGEPQTIIHESRVQLNTDDTKGPYEILTVVTSNNAPLKVSLIYSTDGWATKKTLPMFQISEVGEDVFLGKIPGQAAGTTIQYYIEVKDNNENTHTDPTNIPPTANAVTYKFTVLAP